MHARTHAHTDRHIPVSVSVQSRYLAELGYPEYVLETRMSRLRAPKMYGLHPMQPDANGSGQEPESPGSKPPPPPRADSLKLVSLSVCA